MLSTFYLPKEIEAQRGEVTCPKVHSQQAAELGFEPSFGCSEHRISQA